MTKLARTWHCINPCCLQWAWQSYISYSRKKTAAHDFTRRQHALWMPGQSEQCPWKIRAQGCSLASPEYVLLEVYHQMDDGTAGSPCSRPLGLPAVLMAPESHLREKLPDFTGFMWTMDQQARTAMSVCYRHSWSTDKCVSPGQYSLHHDTWLDLPKTGTSTNDF